MSEKLFIHNSPPVHRVPKLLKGNEMILNKRLITALGLPRFNTSAVIHILRVRVWRVVPHASTPILQTQGGEGDVLRNQK